MICINDSDVIEDIREPRRLLVEAFEEVLPKKSAFER
jgi:hypothetical protein